MLARGVAVGDGPEVDGATGALGAGAAGAAGAVVGTAVGRDGAGGFAAGGAALGAHALRTMLRLSEQAAREIESAGKAAKKELRRYAAEQSVRLAEEIVRREMKPEDDARLIASNIEELGGAAQ